MTKSFVDRLSDRALHSRAHEIADAPTGAEGFELLRGRKYCLLVTFRRDGRAVPTPVWFGLDDDRLYVRSEEGLGKVKRIRREPRVRIAPCNARGKPLGPPVDAVARIVDSSEEERAERALQRSYGLGRRFYERFLAAKGGDYIEVRPA
jgi:PPOX class probable F420-dependent enzyme